MAPAVAERRRPASVGACVSTSTNPTPARTVGGVEPQLRAVQERRRRARVRREQASGSRRPWPADADPAGRRHRQRDRPTSAGSPPRTQAAGRARARPTEPTAQRAAPGVRAPAGRRGGRSRVRSSSTAAASRTRPATHEAAVQADQVGPLGGVGDLHAAARPPRAPATPAPSRRRPSGPAASRPSVGLPAALRLRVVDSIDSDPGPASSTCWVTGPRGVDRLRPRAARRAWLRSAATWRTGWNCSRRDESRKRVRPARRGERVLSRTRIEAGPRRRRPR